MSRGTRSLPGFASSETSGRFTNGGVTRSRIGGKGGTEMATVRVLIADDHAAMRAVLVQALQSQAYIEATRRIVQRNPGIKVIGLSVHCCESYARQMFEAGARAYLLKDGDIGELLDAIDAVCRGRTYISPAMVNSGRPMSRLRTSWRLSHTG
jgi:DNA-binding NarL/FixJ family response regulator